MNWVDNWLQGSQALMCPECGGFLSIAEKSCYNCGRNFHGGGKGGGGGNVKTVNSNYRIQPLPDKIIDQLDNEDSYDTASAAQTIGLDRGTLNHWDRLNRDWAQGADSSVKESIADMAKYDPKVRAVSLFSWYAGDMMNRHINKTGEHEPFSNWLEQPQTLYRVGGVHHPFSSFTSSERRARDASGFGEGGGPDTVTKLSIAPKHVLASYGSGEQYVEPGVFTGG